MDLHYFAQLGKTGPRVLCDFQDPAQFLPPEDTSYYIILMNAMTRISKSGEYIGVQQMQQKIWDAGINTSTS